MNLLKNSLIAIAMLAVVSGSALAKGVDLNSNPGNPARGVSDPRTAFSESKQHSFTDNLDLRIGTESQAMVTVAVNVANRGPAGSLVQSVGAQRDLLRAPSGRATGSVIDAVAIPDVEVIDLPAELVAGTNAGREPGPTGRRQMGSGFLFSVAAIPEPADWMTLLCGFVVVAFIARRKTGAVAD